MNAVDRPTVAEFHELLLKIEDEARKIAWAPMPSGVPSRRALQDALSDLDATRAREDDYQAARLA